MVYTVKKGDTLYKIARDNGLTLEQLLSLNDGIKNPNRIQIGQSIITEEVDPPTTAAVDSAPVQTAATVAAAAPVPPVEPVAPAVAAQPAEAGTGARINIPLPDPDSVEAAKLAQRMLNEHLVAKGQDPLTVDGKFGAKSAAALKSILGNEAQLNHETLQQLYAQSPKIQQELQSEFFAKPETVKQAQFMLNRLGADIAVDGQMGENTAAALQTHSGSTSLNAEAYGALVERFMAHTPEDALTANAFEAAKPDGALRYGDTHDSLAALRQLAYDRGFISEKDNLTPANGNRNQMDDTLRQALIDMQKAAGVKADGIYGSNTHQALLEDMQKPREEQFFASSPAEYLDARRVSDGSFKKPEYSPLVRVLSPEEEAQRVKSGDFISPKALAERIENTDPRILKAYQDATTLVNRKYGTSITVEETMAMAAAESGFGNPRFMKSPAGARGDMQIMEGTYNAMKRANPHNITADFKDISDINNIEARISGIYAGVEYMGKLNDSLGNSDEVVMAYNAGPGSLSKFNSGTAVYAETRKHVEKNRFYSENPDNFAGVKQYLSTQVGGGIVAAGDIITPERDFAQIEQTTASPEAPVISAPSPQEQHDSMRDLLKQYGMNIDSQPKLQAAQAEEKDLGEMGKQALHHTAHEKQQDRAIG